MKSVKFTINAQYLKYGKDSWSGKPLHSFQSRFLHDDLKNVSIIEAPTGAGKTFGFGLLLYKERSTSKYHRTTKLLIVSPTKILSSQIKNDIESMYGDDIFKISLINGDTLVSKGIHRWREILEISSQSDVSIVTPDLINFLITSGYHRSGSIDFTWNIESFLEFFKGYSHIIIDEFHLYDEEQIANILLWREIYKVFKFQEQAKLLFVSATPTGFLKEFFEKDGMEYELITESIIDKQLTSKEGRIIHGEITVELLAEDSVQPENYLGYVSEKNILKYWSITKENKILCIYNSLYRLHQDKKKSEFSNYESVVEVSGYDKRYNASPEILEKSLIVMGTSALEQGVNLGINNAIMSAGYTPHSLIQRFGRIARGDFKGNIAIFLPNEVLQKIRINNSKIDINEFYSQIYSAYSLLFNLNTSSKIYAFMGAFWFQIINQMSNKDTKELLNQVRTQQGKSVQKYYKILAKVTILIHEIADRRNRNVKRELESFIQEFMNSFKSFRSSGINKVLVFDKDLNLETEYALDWIIKNKEIVGEKDGTLTVVNRSGDEGRTVMYTVSSLPSLECVGVKLQNFEINKRPISTYLNEIKKYYYEMALHERQGFENNIKIFEELLSLLESISILINSKRFIVKKCEDIEDLPALII